MLQFSRRLQKIANGSKIKPPNNTPMATAVKLPDHIIEDAKKYSRACSRSVPKQLEHWIKIGRAAEDNPDLSYEMIHGILLGLEEAERGELIPYQPD